MNNFILRNQVFIYFFLPPFSASPFQRWLQKESRWNQGESEENIYRYDILHFFLFYIATYFTLPSYDYRKLPFTGLIICVCICTSLSVSLSLYISLSFLSLSLSHFYLSLSFLSLSLFYLNLSFYLLGDMVDVTVSEGIYRLINMKSSRKGEVLSVSTINSIISNAHQKDDSASSHSHRY